MQMTVPDFFYSHIFHKDGKELWPDFPDAAGIWYNNIVMKKH